MSWPEQVATMPLHLHSPPRHKSLAMAGTKATTKKLSTDNILTLPQLAPDQLARGERRWDLPTVPWETWTARL